MNLHIRTAELTDAPAIDALLTAYAIARRGPLPAAGAALDRLTTPESIPAVVEDGAEIIGFGQAWPFGEAVRCFARVHPGHVGRGAGTLLLDRLEPETVRFGRPAFTVMQPAGDVAATDLLTARGYEVICHVLRMEMSLENHRAAAAGMPEGVELTGYRPGDDAALFSAFKDANPGEPSTEAQWWRAFREDPSQPYDPSLWFVARQGSEIVGYALGSRHELDGRTVGYVAEVGVRPAARGRGIAFAVLSRTIAAFAEAGLSVATLNVDADNLTGAIRLYRKVGMHPVPLSFEWSKQAAPGLGPGTTMLV